LPATEIRPYKWNNCRQVAEDSMELYIYKVKDKRSETIENGFEADRGMKITCADDISGYGSSLTN
jgi:hypothetical protein